MEIASGAGLAMVHHLKAIVPSVTIFALATREGLDAAANSVALGGTGTHRVMFGGDPNSVAPPTISIDGAVVADTSAPVSVGGIDIAMRIALERATRKSCGINQAGVVELVLHANITRAEQGLHHREIRHEAAAEQQRTRHLQPIGKLTFQRCMRGGVAADQMRCSRARPMCLRAIAQRGHNARMP